MSNDKSIKEPLEAEATIARVFSTRIAAALVMVTALPFTIMLLFVVESPEPLSEEHEVTRIDKKRKDNNLIFFIICE
ncbi:hypothetical protein GCM10011343_07810 [Flavobacterium orientale]|uniref:Uncharacterized protein n=1 Tax=Flavobacterium orientale TaxID=1756020 RepID=A0A916XXK0_9FLAO|nr:hypothetical protein GCM10011343_07810 [Flavobacterium orientale]